MKTLRRVLFVLLLILSTGVESYADVAPLPEPVPTGTKVPFVAVLIVLIIAAALIIRAILRRRK